MCYETTLSNGTTVISDLTTAEIIDGYVVIDDEMLIYDYENGCEVAPPSNHVLISTDIMPTLTEPKRNRHL
jgi:hypothetical protein